MKIKEELDDLKRIGISQIHIDVIDTTFADNISFGPEIINQILENDFIFQIHIMIKEPLKLLNQINMKNIHTIVVHSHYNEIKSILSKSNIKIGVAIDPDQIIEDVGADFYLVMTVKPGFGGQKMINNCLKKIDQAKSMGLTVGVDGGINTENIHLVKHSDYIVIGSALIKSNNRKEYYEDLKRLAFDS